MVIYRKSSCRLKTSNLDHPVHDVDFLLGRVFFEKVIKMLQILQNITYGILQHVTYKETPIQVIKDV